MGYRSDVRLVTTEKNWKKLSEHMSEWAIGHVAGAEQEKWVRSCFSPDLFERGNGLVYAGWDDIKWYDSYDPEFKEFMKFLRTLQPFNYLRIGEEEDDIDRIERDKDYELPYIYIERKPDDRYVLDDLHTEVK